MYVKYTYLPSQTQAGLLSDLVKIITTNSVAGLSAGANTNAAFTAVVSNTTPGNWAVHDAAPANNVGNFPTGTSQCLKSVNTDGTSTKYMQLGYTNGPTNTGIALVGWENWNASGTASILPPSTVAIAAHTGLNPTASQNLIVKPELNASYNLTIASTIWLLFTTNYIMVVSDLAQGERGVIMAEFSRDTPTTAGGSPTPYPCHVVWSLPTDLTPNGAATAVGVSRIKNPMAVGDFAAMATNNSATPISNGNSLNYGNVNRPIPFLTNPPTQAPNSLGAGEVPFTLTAPIVIGGGSPWGANLVVLGQLRGGLLSMPVSAPSCSQLDEMVVDGTTYVILKAPGISSILVPKV